MSIKTIDVTDALLLLALALMALAVRDLSGAAAPALAVLANIAFVSAGLLAFLRRTPDESGIAKTDEEPKHLD